MDINGVGIEDTHAEAFEMSYARIIVTARNGKWVYESSRAAVGCATSIIGCGCEAGFEALGEDFKTPDGRPGQKLLFFAMTNELLKKELVKRAGQTLLPTPTVMVFNGLDDGEEFGLGEKIGYFGNGYQKEEQRHGRNCVVVPITSGEFVMEKTIKIGKGVGGANFWIFAKSHKTGLRAAEKSVEAISKMESLILPFAGGAVAAASRPGSKYPFLGASTQEDYCPSITAEKNPERKLPEGVEAVFEIVVNAASLETAKDAMRAGIEAAASSGGIVKIGAANFGGKLGNINIGLHELFG